jgi:glycopeptide antibiotics resistance protein
MKKRFIPLSILIIYSAILVRVMVFKDVPTIKIGSVMLNFAGTDGGSPANFVPFKTIVPYLLGNKGLIIAGVNLSGNIALLVPIGLLLPFIFRSITWKKSLAVAVGAGLIIETLQTLLHVGIFDIDDVILNALGVMLGYWTSRLFIKWARARNYKNIVITALVAAVAAAAVYGFVVYPMGHRGVTTATGEGAALVGGDPCNGTPGTGQIVRIGSGTITIKLRDDTDQTMSLASSTLTRTSAGRVPQSDLKVGDTVTVVINDGKTASAVLVCGVSGSK